MRLDNVACLLVAVGSAFALANLVVTVSIMALDRSGVIARSWVIGVVGGVVGYVVAGTETGALIADVLGVRDRRGTGLRGARPSRTTGAGWRSSGRTARQCERHASSLFGVLTTSAGSLPLASMLTVTCSNTSRRLARAAIQTSCRTSHARCRSPPRAAGRRR